ncbi:MAG: hypothetical protein JST50_02330 [Bacteroidetes bacterium]|nr:hypothetical protein [Bacteroidota bacterium]
MFSIVSILLCGASGIKQKTDGTIVLRDEKINFTPREFYIADVADERKDRGPVADLIITKPDHSIAFKKLDLKDGPVKSIRQFIIRNLHRDTSLRPVVVTLKEFKITETKQPNGQISGRLGIVFSFSLQASYRSIHLVDYTGGIRYVRQENIPVDAEAILRQGIEGTLDFFNTWINSNSETNTLLAKAVKLRFTDNNETPEGDTIYYSAKRPLTWADFKDRPRDNHFEAEIIPVMGYTEQNRVANGIIYVDMAIKVSVAKSDCWVKGEKDDYVLNHEQRHFDIEKIVGERYKKKLLSMKLPTDNFYGPINVEYLEALRNATSMQKQYDAETRHGEDRLAQAQWNEEIDKELREFGVKK